MSRAFAPVVLLIALFAAMVWWQGGRIDTARQQIGQANQKIADLAQVNTEQAAQLTQAATERARAYALLQTLGERLDVIDNNTKGNTNAVKRAIAAPAPGRPNCRDEPLPADAVRLLQPGADTDHGGQAGAGAAAGGPDAPLP
ncbi:hypothetical protein [Aeromonas enteropelogenes]|uniref:hypothetical protein n=1 Tax=Aeromonas enteropelogenes TaxID=29489 RepID=UPI003BA03ADF